MTESAGEPAGRRCRNCGAQLAGEYCSRCGQREGGGDRYFSELAGELIGDLVDVDSRFWRTLYYLELQPGRLSADYFAGRRARYLPPLRLYLVLSFCLFLALSLGAGSRNGQLIVIGTGDAAATGPPAQGALPPDVQGDPNDLGVFVGFTDASSPAWLRAADQRLQQNVKKLKSNPQGFLEAMLDYMPQMMFLLLPLFALLLQCVYLFAPFHYLQHLVFALHYHAFLYLQFLLVEGVQYLVPKAGALVYLWMLAYLPLALRRSYGSGWGGAIGRSLCLYLGYALLINLGLVAVLIVALYLL